MNETEREANYEWYLLTLQGNLLRTRSPQSIDVTMTKLFQVHQFNCQSTGHLSASLSFTHKQTRKSIIFISFPGVKMFFKRLTFVVSITVTRKMLLTRESTKVDNRVEHVSALFLLTSSFKSSYTAC